MDQSRENQGSQIWQSQLPDKKKGNKKFSLIMKLSQKSWPNQTLLVRLISVIFVSVIFIGCFALFKQIEVLKAMKDELHRDLDYLKTSQISDRDDLNKQLTLLREELIKYKSQQEGRDQILGLTKLNQNQTGGTDLLPTPTIPLPVSIKGIIKLKKNWQTADVFQEAKASAKILSQLVQDKLYFVYEVGPAGWYKIEYNLNQQGWVQASLVDEL